MLLFLPLVLVFAIACALGVLLARKMHSVWTTGIVAFVCAIALQFVVARVSFNGLPSEMAVCAIATLLGAPIFAMAHAIGTKIKEVVRSDARPWQLIVAVPILFVLVGPGLMVVVQERLRYASHIAWSANGTIVEKYLDKSNHQEPTLVVRDTSGKRTRFTAVAPAFYSAAAVNDSFHKDRGHATAVLNGAAMQIVRPRFIWFGITQAVAPD